MQPWLLSVAVVWSGSVRMFCQPRWFLTITCCEWRGCQSRSLKRKQEELKPEEKRRMLCPLQCRYDKSKHLMKEKYWFLSYRWTANQRNLFECVLFYSKSRTDDIFCKAQAVFCRVHELTSVLILKKSRSWGKSRRGKGGWGDIFFSPSPSFTPMLTSGIDISSLPNLPYL